VLSTAAAEGPSVELTFMLLTLVLAPIFSVAGVAKLLDMRLSLVNRRIQATPRRSLAPLAWWSSPPWRACSPRSNCEW
jgi:uncharacterized membrane protein YphA (DoxX/SURF4 family)